MLISSEVSVIVENLIAHGSDSSLVDELGNEVEVVTVRSRHGVVDDRSRFRISVSSRHFAEHTHVALLDDHVEGESNLVVWQTGFVANIFAGLQNKCNLKLIFLITIHYV